MLVLNNDDVRAALPMPVAIDVLERAYRDLAEGSAQATTTRLDTRAPLDADGRFFSFMSMEGTTPDGGIMALRFNANHEKFVLVDGKKKKAHLSSAPGARYLGLVLLIAMRETRPLALIHDGYLSGLRVGATSALAARHMARPDAVDAAILGCGDQARTQLLGLAAVRPLRSVRVFCRDEARRAAFAADMSALIGVPVEPAPDTRSAVEGASLVAVATNSYDPVFSADWLSPGCHLAAIVPGEVDPAAYQRAEVTIVNSKVPFGNERGYLAGNDTDWGRFPDLGELLVGKAAGRASPEQITFFMNNAGLGHQFAACGAAILAEAQARGLGREVPEDWLLQPVVAWSAAPTESAADEPA